MGLILGFLKILLLRIALVDFVFHISIHTISDEDGWVLKGSAAANLFGIAHRILKATAMLQL
jgi:hypothetical protein